MRASLINPNQVSVDRYTYSTTETQAQLSTALAVNVVPNFRKLILLIRGGTKFLFLFFISLAFRKVSRNFRTVSSVSIFVFNFERIRGEGRGEGRENVNFISGEKKN